MVNDPGRPSGGGGRGTEHVVPFYSKGGPRKNKGGRPPRGGGRGAQREVPFYRQGGPQQSQCGPSPSRGGGIGMESGVPFYRQGGPLVSQRGPRPLSGGRMEDDSRRGGVVGNDSKFIKGKVLKHHEEMCTVYVSNLPSEMTPESIKELEEFISHQTGGRNLLSSTLSYKSEGNPELTCVFKSKKFAKLCIKKVPKKLFHGHRLLVSSVRGHSNYCVKVTNISKLSTEEALRKLFESCGQIKMIHINDAKPGCTRDALVSFVGPEDSVKKALKLDGAELGPYHIQVMQHNGKGMDQMSKTLGAHIKPKSMASKGMNKEEEVEEKVDLMDRIRSIMGKPKSTPNKLKDEEIEEGEEAIEDEEIEEGEEAEENEEASENEEVTEDEEIEEGEEAEENEEASEDEEVTEDEEIEEGEEVGESVEVTEDEEVSGDEEVTEDDTLTEDEEIEDAEEITEDEEIEEGEEVKENAEVTEKTDEDKEAKDASDEEDDDHQKELKDIENMVRNWTDDDEEEAEKDQDTKSRSKNYLKETKSSFKKQMNKPRLSKSSNVGKIRQQQSSNIGLKRKRNDKITMKGRKKAKQLL